MKVNLRFGCVVRAVDVTDVLSALEYSECQARQEVASCEKTGSRAQGESCVLPQEVADLLELGYAVGLEDLLVHEFVERENVLLAGVFGHKVHQGVEHSLPGLVLGLGVGDDGNRIAKLVGKGDLSDQFPEN